MPCCGQRRSQVSIAGQTDVRQSSVQPIRTRHSVAYFQYVGPTAMTVVGPVTGTRYRFDGPGAVLPVDLRDRAAVAAVLKLRQVLGP